MFCSQDTLLQIAIQTYHSLRLAISPFRTGTMRRYLTHLLLLLLLPSSLAQADDQLDCPDESLTTYLVALIDTLYNNGLTTYEQLLATISSTDSGYTLLNSWYSDQSLTIYPPTDSAFQAANIYPPFTGMSESELVNLIALHTLTGTWTYDKLPQSPMHVIVPTLLGIQGYMNSTTNSTADQAMVLQQGDGGAVSVRMANGNGTTWSGPIDLSGTPLTNIAVLPIDTVRSFLSADLYLCCPSKV